MKNLFESTGMDNDPFGLWASAVSTAASAPGAVSFSAGGDESAAPETVEPVFRVNLPAEGASAARALAASEEHILRLNAALENVPARLDGLVARTLERRQSRQKASASGVSFDTLSLEESEPGPEGELLTMLASAESAKNGGMKNSASACRKLPVQHGIRPKPVLTLSSSRSTARCCTSPGSKPTWPMP